MVTSFAEVWIEMLNISHICSTNACHFLRGSVDWNIADCIVAGLLACHFLRGSVDWNPGWSTEGTRIWWSLPSRKCGLKCSNFLPPIQLIKVTSFAEVWIEIAICRQEGCPIDVTSFAEVWIEIIFSTYTWKKIEGHFLRGSVDWNFNSISPICSGTWSLPSRKCGLKL